MATPKMQKSRPSWLRTHRPKPRRAAGRRERGQMRMIQGRAA